MANISNYLRDKILNEVLGGTAFAPAATLYAKAFSTALNAAGAGTELAGSGYAPIEIANNTTNFPAQTDGSKELAVMHESAEASADWLDILAIGLFDGDGNLYFYENYGAPIEVLNGQKLRLNIGAIVVTLS